jgi:hypothetical protein
MTLAFRNGSDPMIDVSSSLEPLTVVIDGRPVGTMSVVERHPRKLFGRFVTGPEFEPYRPVFEAAVELARRFDATPTTGPCDDLLWDRLMGAYAEINNLGPKFAEVRTPIEEFAVQADWSVEVTFEGLPE